MVKSREVCDDNENDHGVDGIYEKRYPRRNDHKGAYCRVRLVTIVD